MDAPSIKVVSVLIEQCVHGIFELLKCSGVPYLTRADFVSGVTPMRQPDIQPCLMAMHKSYSVVVGKVLTTLYLRVKPINPNLQIYKKRPIASTLRNCIDKHCNQTIAPDVQTNSTAINLIDLFDELSGKLQLITRMLVGYISSDSVLTPGMFSADHPDNFMCEGYGPLKDDQYRMRQFPIPTIRRELMPMAGGGRKRRATTPKWIKTDRKVKGTGKTLYRNNETGELRIRKMVSCQNGTKRVSYVKR